MPAAHSTTITPNTNGAADLRCGAFRTIGLRAAAPARARNGSLSWGCDRVGGMVKVEPQLAQQNSPVMVSCSKAPPQREHESGSGIGYRVLAHSTRFRMNVCADSG